MRKTGDPSAESLPGDFAAIDFETANYRSTSACAVGLAVVRNWKIAGSYAALIRPEPFCFVPRFSDIHGISPEDVEDKKDFGGVWPEIEERIKGLPLLAHNAPFDRSVLGACLKFFGIAFPQPEFICTCRLSRAAFPGFPDHKLGTVCRMLNIALEHHNACSDALACAKIALRIYDGGRNVMPLGRLKPAAWLS